MIRPWRISIPGGAIPVESYPVHWIDGASPSAAIDLEIINATAVAGAPTLYATEAGVLEAKSGADPWTALTDDPDTGYTMASIAGGALLAFQVRVNFTGSPGRHRAARVLVDGGT